MAHGDALMATVLLKDAQGRPVNTVDPFLGAPAHWALFGNPPEPQVNVPVAHAHPMGFGAGKAEFHIELPESGAYQGWLQFQPTGQPLVTVPLSATTPAKPGGGHGGHGSH